MEGTGFRLIMGFIIIAVALILWLPLNDTVDGVKDVFNNMTTGNATYDAEMRENNNIVAAFFANFPVFLMLVYGMWVIKGAMGERRLVVQ